MIGPDAAEQIAHLPFGVILTDTSQRVASANPAAQELFGSSVAPGIPFTLGSVVTADSGDQLAGAHSLPLILRDAMVRTREGERRATLTATPLSKSAGWTLLSIVAEPAERHLPDADDLGRHAPAVLAHEIKNPLAAIRGAAQLIARGENTRDLALVSLIGTEVERISRLVDRMQMLGATVEPDLSVFNVHAAIRAVLEARQAACPEQAPIIEEFDPSLPPVHADRAGLEQVLTNLIANAASAVAGQADGRLTVRTRCHTGWHIEGRDGRRTALPAEIVVLDNGPGVDPKLQNSIFEPFVTGRQGGQGLGLAIARKLTHAMGGAIHHVRRDETRETEFRILLPFADGATT